MEAEALTPSSPLRREPPALLAQLVLCLIPPAARESVAGDLWELYRSPLHYARDALRVLPFVVFSQVRRTADLPVLALQGVLLFSLFGIFGPAFAAGATAAILGLLLLAGAYRESGRPSTRRAMVEAVLAAGGFAELFGLMAAHFIKPGWYEAPYFAFLGPYMVPLLCLARTLVVLWEDTRHPRAVARLSLAEVRGFYQAFQQRAKWRNDVEIGLLLGSGFVLAWLPQHAFLLVSLCAYLATALYLLLDGGVRPLPRGVDFAAARKVIQDELTRQHRIRCFVGWLWFVPLMLEIRASMAAGGAGRPLALLGAMALLLLSGFFIAWLNRERQGRLQEEIGTLAKVQERFPSC
jgi:hypothetical protein